MKPLPALILVLAAHGLLSNASGIDEAYHFELLLAVIAGVGVLGVLRGLSVPLGGLLWDAYSERQHWLTASGVTIIVACLGLAGWRMGIGS